MTPTFSHEQIARVSAALGTDIHAWELANTYLDITADCVPLAVVLEEIEQIGRAVVLARSVDAQLESFYHALELVGLADDVRETGLEHWSLLNPTPQSSWARRARRTLNVDEIVQLAQMERSTVELLAENPVL